MKIKFSRHARRRASLYEIPESTIANTLGDLKLSNGVHELIKDITGFKYPIKIVFSVEADSVTVITSYPLKKGRSQ